MQRRWPSDWIICYIEGKLAWDSGNRYWFINLYSFPYRPNTSVSDAIAIHPVVCETIWSICCRRMPIGQKIWSMTRVPNPFSISMELVEPAFRRHWFHIMTLHYIHSVSWQCSATIPCWQTINIPRSISCVALMITVSGSCFSNEFSRLKCIFFLLSCRNESSSHGIVRP